jgi:hypothetical protein
VIPFLGFDPKERKAEYRRDLYTDVHHSTIHNSQALETIQMPYI